MDPLLKALIPRKPTSPLALPRTLLLGLFAIPASIFAYQGLYNVDGGHRAVIFNKLVGVREKTYEEGTIWRWPMLEEVIDYDVRMRPRSIGSLTGSKDLQMVKITLRVLYRPDPDKLPTIFRTLSTDFDDRVLPSIVNEVTKSVVAQYNASQLIVQREIVSSKVRECLTSRAKDFHLLLGDVSITHLSFGKEYSNAVEAKQVAQQEAERAKFIVEKAEQDKQSAIIRASGEAKSARMIGEAIKVNPNFLTLRKYEAAREIAKIISTSDNKVYLPSEMLLVGKVGESAEASSMAEMSG